MSNKLENYIQSHLEEVKRKKPDPAILGRILAEMKSKESENVNRRSAIIKPLTLLKWAAACLFFVLCFFGVRYMVRQKPEKVVSKINKLPEKESTQQLTANSTGHTTIKSADLSSQIITSTVDNQVKAKPIASFSGLSNMESAATRINAVVAVSKVTGNNIAVIDTLVRVLNNDPNANVRLAAMDGLTRFYGDDYAIKELTASLKNQLDPVIQINLITLLVRKREVGVLPDLKRMVKDAKLEKSVKDFAYSGILQLNPEILN